MFLLYLINSFPLEKTKNEKIKQNKILFNILYSLFKMKFSLFKIFSFFILFSLKKKNNQIEFESRKIKKKNFFFLLPFLIIIKINYK
jgi:hypothetical protein